MTRRGHASGLSSSQSEEENTDKFWNVNSNFTSETNADPPTPPTPGVTAQTMQHGGTWEDQIKSEERSAGDRAEENERGQERRGKRGTQGPLLPLPVRVWLLPHSSSHNDKRGAGFILVKAEMCSGGGMFGFGCSCIK